MPNYTFKNKFTNEELIINIPIAELDQFYLDHPELVQVFVAIPQNYKSFSMRSVPEDYKSILKKMKKDYGESSTINV